MSEVEVTPEVKEPALAPEPAQPENKSQATEEPSASTPSPEGKSKKPATTAPPAQDPVADTNPSQDFDPEQNSPPVSQDSEVDGEGEPVPPMQSLSQMVLTLPEATKQNIYDCMVSYVQNSMERDTILHSVFQKAEKALVEELNR